MPLLNPILRDVDMVQTSNATRLTAYRFNDAHTCCLLPVVPYVGGMKSRLRPSSRGKRSSALSDAAMYLLVLFCYATAMLVYCSVIGSPSRLLCAYYQQERKVTWPDLLRSVGNMRTSKIFELPSPS